MSLKIAAIGLGHMGTIHLNKLVTFEGIEISAIVDTDAALVTKLSKNVCANAYADHRDAVQSCDGAIIASPTKTHYAIGKAFLEAGKHVLMEKPVTVDPHEAQKLIDIANRNKLIFQVGHLERFNPAFSQALHFIEKPILIEGRRISPFTGRSTDVDVVLDLMIHDLDLVLSLMNNEIRELSAQGVCFMTDKLDAASARIEFTDGCVANLMASRISTKRERTITIYEEDKSFSIDLLQGKFVSLVKNSDGTVDTTEYTATHVDPVQEELLEFIDSIQGKKTPSVTGIDGLKALVLANRIKEYIAEKRRVSNIQ